MHAGHKDHRRKLPDQAGPNQLNCKGPGAVVSNQETTHARLLHDIKSRPQGMAAKY